MGTLTFAKRTCAAIAFTCALLTLTGCGSGESEAVAQDPQVDPRFATADALLDHYNSFATREPVDADAIMGLMYAENPTQQQLIDIIRNMIPMAKLDHAFFERFNECVNPKDKRHMLFPDEPARMTKRDPGRCEAEYKDHKGNKETLYLVLIGERWWVSGYTLEYDPEVKEVLEDLVLFERGVRAMSAAAQPLIDKVRRGDFATIADARRAFSEQMIGQALIERNR